MTFFVLCALVTSMTAAEENQLGGLWGGIEIGVGSVRLNADESETETTVYLNFKGGIELSEQWLLGIELGGYTLDTSDIWDPSEGAGISQVYLVSQYYFQTPQKNWYLKGGAGYLSFWDNDTDEFEESGWGAMIGLGHNWQTNGWGKLGPLIVINYGKAGDINYTSIAVALSWSSL